MPDVTGQRGLCNPLGGCKGPGLLGEQVERLLVALDCAPESLLKVLVGAALLDSYCDRLADDLGHGNVSSAIARASSALACSSGRRKLMVLIVVSS